MSKETTIKLLSQISGFSVSSVSKALKNKKGVSQVTRKKIKALANTYNYVPNNSAVALRSRKTNTIAVVVPKIDNIIYGSFLNSIQDEAFKRGYRVILQQYLSCKNGDYSYLENLRYGCVDGIIVIQPITDMAFDDSSSQQSDVKYYPRLIYTIENLNLELINYKNLGKKMVKSLFSKIDSTNRNTTFKT
jgi:DNA-binding LacI/PurR family transcriptional regulator